MALRLIQDVRFGHGGNDAPLLGAGWSADEPGYRWTLGERSELWLRHPGEGDLLLDLDVTPFLAPPAVVSQRLVIHADEALVASLALTAGSRRGVRVAAGALAGRRDVRLGFLHPDSGRPSDHGLPDDSRRLALSFQRLSLFGLADPVAARLDGTGGLALADVEARTGLAPERLATRFESLGDNCEFGLVQRKCGAEPLGLLRFSNIELPQLLRALDADFEGLGEPANMGFRLAEGARREYVLHDAAYALVFHTFQYEGEAEGRSLPERQARRLHFLRRKLLEDVALGEKIFVVRRNPPLSEPEVLPLVAALGRHGPCTVLWITLADADHRPGTVERVMPGLLRGYLDRIAPDDNAHDMALRTWLEICANALAIGAPNADARHISA